MADVVAFMSSDGASAVAASVKNPLPVTLEGSGGSSAVTVVDGGNTTFGAEADAAAAADNSTATYISLFKRLLAKFPVIGTQVTAAAIATSVATDDVIMGSRTEAAPASDTASSGLNGRLQRIAQNITSLLAIVQGNVNTGALITLAAAAPTTTNSADQTNANGRGVQVTVDITAIATQTVTVNIQGKDTASGKYYTLLASSALASVATTVLSLYPGDAVSANLSASNVLPKTWRVQAVGAVGGTVTLTVGACVIV